MRMQSFAHAKLAAEQQAVDVGLKAKQSFI